MNHLKRRKKSHLPLIIFVAILALTLWFVLKPKAKQTANNKTIVGQVNTKKSSFFNTLQTASKQLNPEGFKLYNKPSYTLINLFVNPKKYEFDFVNAFLTYELENAGGILLSGIKKGHWLELAFFDEKEKAKYLIKIFYKKEIDENPYKIALIIDDFGYYAGQKLDDFLALDENIVFAIIPELKHSTEVMQKAKKQNREAIIHLPMEPISYPVNDPGDNAIFIQLSSSEIKKRTNNFIKQLPYCTGLNNHMGSLATADSNVMQAVLEEIKKHNMFFIDSRTTSSSVAYKTAIALGVPTAEKKFFLDVPKANAETTSLKLKKLAKIKANKKSANIIVISHCTKKNNLEQIKSFVNQAKSKGWVFVPVSTIITNKDVSL